MANKPSRASCGSAAPDIVIFKFPTAVADKAFANSLTVILFIKKSPAYLIES